MARYHDDDEMSCVAHDMLMTHVLDLARLAVRVCILILAYVSVCRLISLLLQFGSFLINRLPVSQGLESIYIYPICMLIADEWKESYGLNINMIKV